MDHTRGGRVASGGGRISVLATTVDGASRVRYLELAPDGPTWVTAMIQGAGEPIEPAENMPALLARDGSRVLKFVLFSASEPSKLPDSVAKYFEDEPAASDAWAPMGPTVAMLRDALRGTGAEVLDCGPNQCEVLPPRINKGAGLASLLAELSVSPAHTLACGDAENDVEMLQLVGVGVAMANAKPQALAACDVQTASCAEDGVAQAVERFALAPARDA